MVVEPRGVCVNFVNSPNRGCHAGIKMAVVTFISTNVSVYALPVAALNHFLMIFGQRPLVHLDRQEN